jgi:hypothetical protein
MAMTVKILSRITVTNSLPTLKIRDYFAVYIDNFYPAKIRLVNHRGPVMDFEVEVLTDIPQLVPKDLEDLHLVLAAFASGPGTIEQIDPPPFRSRMGSCTP